MPTFETIQPVVLSIEMSRGAVHVIADERTDTVVAVEPSDRDRPEDVQAADKTVVDMADGTVAIRGPKSRGIAANLVGWRGAGSVEVTVGLPERSSLRADTGVASFRCEGRLGDVRVKSGVGHVAVEEVSGRVEIVAAGDMTIGAVTGDADVRNHSGRTWIGRVAGDARVRSANGDVTIEDAGGDVRVKTANGTIRLGQVARGSVTIESAAGGLEIGVREGTAARIDATTKNGRVHDNLPPVDDPEPPVETVQVRARTSYGDVLIARAPVLDRQGGI